MKPAPQPAPADHRLARWERIGLGIRLAYNPRNPDVVRLWIGLGLKLADDGVASELDLLRRMLRLLMQVAHDEALPWCWRSTCLELSTRPLARLVTVSRLQDPVQAEAMLAFFDVARARLDAVPASQRDVFRGAS